MASNFLYSDNDTAGRSSGNNDKPFFKVISAEDGELLDWLKTTIEHLEEEAKDRIEQMKENLNIYRGIAQKKLIRTSDRDANLLRLNKVQKFMVNHLFDLTETKVSQMTRIKPDVEVHPTNDDWNDRTSSKVVKLVVKHLWYINNIDYIMQQMHRHARIFGESYCFPTWNPFKGDLHPSVHRAKAYGVPVTAVKTGDIEYEIELPWRVFLHRKESYDKCEYLFRLKLVPTEELKADYPEMAEDIHGGDRYISMDTSSLQEEMIEDQTIVYEFFHKKTDKVGEGAYIKFCKDCILERSESLFSWEGLPVVRLTDLDVPGLLNGVSRYEAIAPLQRMYDNIQTLIVKNIYMGAHAKWLMPRGACKIEELGNDNTIVQYQGPVPPTLVTHNTTSPEVFNYAESILRNMQVIYGSHGVSRGEVPKGITATSALQFLNELEAARSTTDIAKHAFTVIDMARQTISLVGDNYKLDDGRLVRIVGDNNSYLLRRFDTAHFHKAYDIRFENSSGLPESKSAKYQRILDAMQRYPEMLSPERWSDLLDMADIEKMNTILTSAIQAADSENEDILAGRPVAPPQEWEDHIAHWESHVQMIQARVFKEETPPEFREDMKDHIFWTEEAMLLKAQVNPLFGAKIARLALFPIYDHDLPMPSSAEHQQAIVQGAANAGNPVTGQIPAEEFPEDTNI